MLKLALAIVILLSSAACGCDVRRLGTSQFAAHCSALDLGANGTRHLMHQLYAILQAESLLSSQLTEQRGIDLSIELQHNMLCDDGAHELGIGLRLLQNVTSLSLELDGNAIADAGVVSLISGLQELVNLELLTLSLQYNAIHAVGAGALGSGLSKLHRLRNLSLQLKFNDISSSGAGDLAESLGNLPMLQALRLGLFSNGIKSAGAADLAAGLSRLHELDFLAVDLRYNDIDSSGAEDLRLSLGQFKNVTEVVVMPSQLLASPTIAPADSSAAVALDDGVAVEAEPVPPSSASDVALASTKPLPAQEAKSKSSAASDIDSQLPAPDGIAVSSTISPETREIFIPGVGSSEHASAADDVSTSTALPTAAASPKRTTSLRSAAAATTTTKVLEAEGTTAGLHEQLVDDAEESAVKRADGSLDGPAELGGGSMLVILCLVVVVVAGLSYAWVKLKSSARDYSNNLPVGSSSTRATTAATTVRDDFNPSASADDFDPNAPLPAPGASQPSKNDDDFNPNEPIRPLKGPEASKVAPKSKPGSSLEALMDKSLNQL